jgi:nitrate/nitrite-specific signal transduction histidine kinase
MAQEADRDLITTIRFDLEAAIARIDTSGSAYVMLVQTLADLVELWEGTAQVSWTMNHRTVRLLAESPPTASSVGEIVTECTSNSIRHGRAQHVKFAIEAFGDVIRVTVIDDGSGVPAIIEPRLGTRMLDELCLNWERTSNREGTTLIADLATERSLLTIP